jgi:carbonic anhydrase
VPVTDELLVNNATYARYFTSGDLLMPPGKKVAVLACMDARLNVYGALGLHEGDAYVIRNAGGVATDDAIRSLVISQRLLGTREIILIHHTDCGMLTFRDEVKAAIEADTGLRPPFAPGGIPRPHPGRAPVDPPHHSKPVCAPQGQRARLRLRGGHRQAPRGDMIWPRYFGTVLGRPAST